ncbi:hypothetical protein JQC91_02220 [Jannaschia sp. Os4]|uniref:hypothetical protein n=1 Tax=Jannaschia sp. Os4 TaxID=2807617 RepID=UPI00193A5C8A|nr:hypothetical protein [Jannaschia sp. Os4]MBM2575109.1 hypothetical protein [Jannaschia sp. Os4]
MIRFLLPLALLAAGCVPTNPIGADAATEAAAFQRMRFAAEAVCLNNRTRAAQERAARALSFPLREPAEAGAVLYVNPATLTFLRIGPSPRQSVTAADGRDVTYQGNGCSVGSPAVGLTGANRVAGEMLQARLVEGDRLTATPVGAGTNAADGVGLFFDDLSVTVPLATTGFTNPDTGETAQVVHPVVLVIHSRGR